MKLVQLLARELKEWPEQAACAVQDGAHWEGMVWFSTKREYEFDARDSTWTIDGAIAGRVKTELATDHATAIITREMWEAERKRIGTPAWNGAGLPKVGTVCEASTTIDFRGQCEIIGYYHERAVWVRWTDPEQFASYPIEDIEFRPIRTPEQIAAEEREKAVAAMLELDPYMPNTNLGMMSRADFCRTLYDHGYRRTE